MAYRVKNWHEYDKSLRNRGDITLWLSQEAIDAWTAPKTGKRGSQRVYSDIAIAIAIAIAIQTALTLRLIFHLPLRQTEGFLHSVLKLMNLTLRCPDHTTLSRRNTTVDIYRVDARVTQGPIAMIVDSSGLKVCGQGEWHAKKHGEKKGKRWKKLHIGLDDQGQTIASTVTDSHEQDPSQVAELLSQVDQTLDRFIGDGIFDQEPVYAAVECHSPGARVMIPPRKDAVLSLKAVSSPTQRDQHLLAIERASRSEWKRTSGYYDQSHAENAFSRFKRTFGGRLRARRTEAQEREASHSCALLNLMRELGRPYSYPVS